ncbi:MAG: HNH endonuclease [Solirubrobacteraceae bacterium]|jgi:5-methylcytosine-specific restriction endonuclease McrA
MTRLAARVVPVRVSDLGAVEHYILVALAAMIVWRVLLLLCRRSRRSGRRWYREDYLHSAHWRERRERSLALAGYRCQRCGNPALPGIPLDPHHKTYKRLGHERDRDIEVLCRNCHDAEHHPLLSLVRSLLRALRPSLRP